MPHKASPKQVQNKNTHSKVEFIVRKHDSNVRPPAQMECALLTTKVKQSKSHRFREEIRKRGTNHGDIGVESKYKTCTK